MTATGRTALDAYAYSDADLTPLPGAVVPAARVALAYGRLHRGAGARWAEVLFGVAGAAPDGSTVTWLDDGDGERTRRRER